MIGCCLQQRGNPAGSGGFFSQPLCLEGDLVLGLVQSAVRILLEGVCMYVCMHVCMYVPAMFSKLLPLFLVNNGLPFRFPTWTAVPTAAGIWLLSLAHYYSRRLNISAMLKC